MAKGKLEKQKREIQKIENQKSKTHQLDKKTNTFRKNAVLYLRVNAKTAMENSHLLKAQQTQLLSYCESHNYHIKNVYLDVDTGESLKREGLQALLKVVQTKHHAIDILVVKNLRSLASTVNTLTALIVLLNEKRVELKTLDKPLKPSRQLPLWHYVHLLQPPQATVEPINKPSSKPRSKSQSKSRIKKSKVNKVKQVTRKTRKK
jgi:predicted site-specific integrase-resolvase